MSSSPAHRLYMLPQLDAVTIKNDWHLLGTLWLMEDVHFIDRHWRIIADALRSADPEKPHEWVLVQDFVTHQSRWQNLFWHAIAENPKLPHHLFLYFAQSRLFAACQALAHHPHLPEDVARILYWRTIKEWSIPNMGRFARKILRALGKNASTPPTLLRLIANSSDAYVREGAAKSPAFVHAEAHHIAHQLARDTHMLVRQAVATNPYTPLDLLIELTYTSPMWLKHIIAHNYQMPVEILQILANEPDVDLREKIAHHPKATPEILFTLIQAEQYHKYTRKKQIIRREVSVKNLPIYIAVIKHPHVTDEILAELAQYENRAIQKALRQRAEAKQQGHIS